MTAHQETPKGEEELTREMAAQLSRGHAEIIRRFKELMESLNGEVNVLKNDKAFLTKERDHFHVSSTKYMDEVNYMRNTYSD